MGFYCTKKTRFRVVMVFCLYDNMLSFKIFWEQRDVLSSYTSIHMPQTCHYMFDYM